VWSIEKGKVICKLKEFLTNKVIFLRFVVSSEGVSVDPEKIRAIEEWPEPQA